jgi:hypothetical protein
MFEKRKTIHRWLKAAAIISALPLAVQAQDFDIQGSVTPAWVEQIGSSGSNQTGIWNPRTRPGASRIASDPDGGVVYAFLNGNFSFDSMTLEARNGSTGDIVWQVNPCPEVEWHNYNVCLVDDLALSGDTTRLVVSGRKEVSTAENTGSPAQYLPWVAVFDTTDGSTVWEQTTDFDGWMTPGSTFSATYIDIAGDQVLLAVNVDVKVTQFLNRETGAFSALDLQNGDILWSAATGTEISSIFVPNDAVLSVDGTTWYVGGTANAEVWNCFSENDCYPNEHNPTYTDGFGLYAVDVQTGALLDLSERAMPTNQFLRSEAFSLALSDDGQYLYQVGSATFADEGEDWFGEKDTARILVRAATLENNVVHDDVHATFPTVYGYFGDTPPSFPEEFNFCYHGQVETGTARLYWHFECGNSKTGVRGSVVKALERDTWGLAWQNTQYSDEEWADGLSVLPSGEVLASGATRDNGTGELNGFLRAMDPVDGESMFRVQYRANQPVGDASQEHIHDIAHGGNAIFGLVSRGNNSLEFPVAIALNHGAGGAPVLTLFDQNIEATGPDGAYIGLAPPLAQDAEDGDLPITCLPAWESLFPLGETLVSCSATDSDGQVGNGAFTANVLDTTPPDLTAPPDVIVTVALVPAVVSLGAPTFSDLVGMQGVDNDAPSAGFPEGSTTVTWTATDTSGNVATATQQVTVNLDTGNQDADGDGVTDNIDMCPATALPESVPTRRLQNGRWALVDGDRLFDTPMKGNKPAPEPYTLDDTAGCSCEQIIAALGLNDATARGGCSSSNMDDWIATLANP